MPDRRLEPSPFIDPRAVEAWDTWFRWRDDGRLRDVSVEATWERVARALTQVESAQPSPWTARIFEAQSRWRLVLDERILARAGTRDPQWSADPVAVLNAAAFVEAPLTPKAAFEAAAFRDVAALAVRCLDDALLQHSAAGKLALPVRVGLIGLADALVLLGKRYDSPAGRVTAGRIAQALAEGCARGSIELAAERGPFPEAAPSQIALARARGLSPEIIEAMAATGVRHARLTEISSQPRLAAFANGVRDALDPIELEGAGASSRTPASYAVAVARALTGGDAHALLPRASLAAQIEMRGVVQPWIDASIGYPFRSTNAHERHSAQFWQNLATAHRLGEVVIAS